MAANDYYNNTYMTSANQDPNDRHNAPLPPPPGNHSQYSVSPAASPFEDHNRLEYPSHTNLTQHQAPMGYDTSYHGADSPASGLGKYSSNPAHDPFADQHAIPLQQQNYGKTPRSRYDDPEGRMSHPKKKKGWFSGRVTWVVYILTTIQVGVFIGELIKNAMLTGSPIEIHPNVNPMLGPSPWVQINMGARYPPCMHNIRGVTDASETIEWPCPDATSLDLSVKNCTLAELCGMGSGVPDQVAGTNFRDRSHEPNQWWRFITPIFLHAGFIHIGFNMLLQMTLGRDMEKEMGPIRFALVYFSAGIFGFVLGGNYAGQNIPSVGASGSLFGILALVLLDLLYNWKTRVSPVKDLLFLLLDIAISFVLGLLPGLDNFSHIGGFCMGLVLGLSLLHSPAALRERIGITEPPYSTVDATGAANDGKPALGKFVKQPVGFFKGRKPFWWAWWLIRAGTLVMVFIGFVLLLKNFYEWRNECSWCKHLTCLPVKDWCNIGNFNITKRDLSPLPAANLFARDGL